MPNDNLHACDDPQSVCHEFALDLNPKDACFLTLTFTRKFFCLQIAWKDVPLNTYYFLSYFTSAQMGCLKESNQNQSNG